MNCAICNHKRVAEIIAALEAGEDELAIAQKFGVTKHWIRKHREHTIIESTDIAPPQPPISDPKPPEYICRATAMLDEALIGIDDRRGAMITHAKSMLMKALVGIEPQLLSGQSARERIEAMITHANEFLSDARTGDASIRDKAAIVSSITRLLELAARVRGELASEITESMIVSSAPWRRLSQRIVDSLKGAPQDVVMRVVKALGEI